MDFTNIRNEKQKVSGSIKRKVNKEKKKKYNQIKKSINIPNLIRMLPLELTG